MNQQTGRDLDKNSMAISTGTHTLVYHTCYLQTCQLGKHIASFSGHNKCQYYTKCMLGTYVKCGPRPITSLLLVYLAENRLLYKIY